jgi:signal transduction histidine kinase
VVQEALHNIVQHSQAREAQIAVKQEYGRLLLSIHDDGKGFDPQKQRGMGLIGMQERVGALGGKLTIDSAVGQGTLLRVELPA